MRRILLLLAALLAAAPLSAQQPTTVILVRHAEKDVEPPADPVLTAAGTQRAAALAELLQDQPLAAILVSEFARTRLTAEPTAARTGLTPRVVEARGGLRPHLLAIVEAVRSEYAGRTVLVVGHSNTVPAIIAALGAEPVGEICDGEYDDLFVVTLPVEGRPTVERRRYGAPDALNACGQTL